MGRVARVLVLLLLCAYYGCASIQPPPGGPEDKTPPTILSAAPKERAINVPRDTRIHFVFADAVDKASFMQAFSITPYVTGKIKYNWSGLDEVEVVLPEVLRENSTYTISLTRDLKSRRGNALLSPLRLSFSTGAAIDTGQLSGILLPGIGSKDPLRLNEIFLFAYDLRFHRPDTLDYTKTPPDLITQANDKGAFEFLAMKTHDTYRVIAVQDAFRNHLYDRGIDNYGLSSGDAILDSTVVSDFRIRMAPSLDTIRPELQDVSADDLYHLRVVFSEGLDTASVRANNFALKELKSGTSIQIAGAYRAREDHHPGELTLVTASPLAPKRDYELDASTAGVHDQAGNPLSDSGKTAHFTVIATRDTFLAPILTPPMTDSTREVSVTPRILLSFSDAVAGVPLDSIVQLIDSSKHPVAMRYDWVDAAHLVLTPLDTLKPRAFYALKISTHEFHSPALIAERQAKDTTYLLRFQTVDFRDDGKISGEIDVPDSMWGSRTDPVIIVELLTTAGNVIQQKVLDGHLRQYEFERVPKGIYRVRAYLSSRGVSTYDAGSIIPFRFAAPSGDFPGELDIRPRWSTEHVNFGLK